MSFFDSIFGGGGYQNPAPYGQQYLSQIPGATGGYFNPYINAGQQTIPGLQAQYGNLTNNPGGVLNSIGAGYQQSPGFKFALDQALGGSDRAAAGGGMVGSPMHQQQNMELATNLANQDYNNWLGKATGLYGAGLQGQQGLYAGGLQAGGSMADMISQALAAQGQMAYTGQQNQNQMNASKRNSNMNLFGQGIGALGAFLPYQGIQNKIGNWLGLGGE